MKSYLETTTQNIAWFKKISDEGDLTMRPQFQRHIVWTEKQMSYLIDSVLHAYPIPELYIQEKVSASGKTQYTVVDGQQRLQSILGFIRGDFQLDETQSEKWGGLSFIDLSDEDKKCFFAYKFIIRILPDMDETELRSIFQRINRYNFALNLQELRQSTYNGNFIKLMNDIANRTYWENIDLFSPSRVRRMLDVEFISELTIALLNGFQNKKSKLDYYYVMYEQEFSDEDYVRTVFDITVPEIFRILPNIKETRWSKLIDFYTLFLVFAEDFNYLPLNDAKRALLYERLNDFSTKINQIQNSIEITDDENYLSKLNEYASGIRNSSDLASRRNRHNSLKAVIYEIVKS